MPDNGLNESKNLVLITNIPTPYRVPLFNEIERQLAKIGIGFTVLFGAKGYARRQWVIDEKDFQFRYAFLKSRNLFSDHDERSSFTYSGLYKKIKELNPDIIITSGFSLGTIKLWIRSFFTNKRYIIWSGSINNDANIPFGQTIRGWLVRRASGYIAYGSKSRDYLVNLGADRKAISIAVNTVDTDFFHTESKKLRTEPSSQSGIQEILYIGNLNPGKRIDLLLRAISRLKTIRSDFKLIIVGIGPEEKRLKKQCRESGVDDIVEFHGFKQKVELVPYLANSCCFAFPSEYDKWGLVLNEAMAAGLPCLASVKAGATEDMIRNDINGFKIDFENTDQVLDKLNWILDHPHEAREMGDIASEDIQSRFTLETSAEGFMEKITQADEKYRSG